ncbi:hypothetical protein M9Y10_034071 [Tritrichomonas musculus]|uniref:ATPase AAA-type core domain-containing protein n=1 Tax=Tritrichomonas musculus TaxID=1915356 RepID=A0ABR2KH17_9EUKA
MSQSHFIVIGPIQSGKTTFINQFLKLLKNDIPRIGFIEECIYKNQERIGYDLILSINESKYQFPFVRLKERITPDDPNMFKFDNNTIVSVKNLIDNNVKFNKSPLIYFDEYGRIESKGLGLFSSMKSIINQVNSQNIPYTTIFTTRKQNLDFLLNNCKKDFSFTSDPNILTLPSNEESKELFIKKINESLVK